MIWCWQQDPEKRPTATQVVEVAKSEQFYRLIDGIHISDSARVLCACKREIYVEARQKTKAYKNRKVSSGCFEMSTELQTDHLSGSFQMTVNPPLSPSRSISEGLHMYELVDSYTSPLKHENSETMPTMKHENSETMPTMKRENSETMPTMKRENSETMNTTGTPKRKLDVVLKYELWVSSSDVHSSSVTILDYCGRFTKVQV